jgi:hypothetical protein
MRMAAEGTEGTGGNRLALVASCAGIFLALLCSTYLNTALPEIRTDLGGAVVGLQSTPAFTFCRYWRFGSVTTVNLSQRTHVQQ